MKATGISKKIDELGRIVIPKDIRRSLGVNNLDTLQFFLDGDSLILRKLEEHCEFCKNTDDLIEFKGKYVCPECKKSLTEA